MTTAEMVGRTVRLTVRPARFSDPTDAQYIMRMGKYADPKYGPTPNGRVFAVTAELDTPLKGKLFQLSELGSGIKVYLAEPEEIEEVEDVDLELWELDAKYHDNLPYGTNCSLCGVEHAAIWPSE